MSLSKGFYGPDPGSEADRVAVIRKALSSGVTLLDTADMYGPYENHVLIGMTFVEPPAWSAYCTCSASQIGAGM